MTPDRFDIFGTFLQTTPPKPTVPPGLLSSLHAGGGTLGYVELWRTSYRNGCTQEEFSDALRRLIDQKLVALVYPPDAAWPDVRLTPIGRGTAEVLTSG